MSDLAEYRENGEAPETERTSLEEARKHWQEALSMLNSTRKIGQEEKKQLAGHLGHTLHYLEELPGTAEPYPLEAYKEELLWGPSPAKKEFNELLEARQEVNDNSEQRDYYPAMLYHLTPKITFEIGIRKAPDREGADSLEFDIAIKHPGQDFYRPAWERLQEKFEEINRKEE